MVGLIEYTAEPYWAGMVEMDPTVLVASAVDIPVKPPKQWFDDPHLSELTPLTVEPNGRVFGHIASWTGSHIGRLGKVRPPRSKSGYQYFRHGVVETDDGTHVPVGQITLVGGHAPLEAGMQAAVAHYDDTRSAMMDVTVGEDRKGIWVAGALRPGVDDIQIRALKASGVSGDWRPIDNRLELVAICAVNVPGFPIPRALAASGLVEEQSEDDENHIALYALVAAGVEPLVALTHRKPTTAALEYALVEIETKMDWMRASLAVLASASEDSEDDDDDDEPEGVIAAAEPVAEVVEHEEPVVEHEAEAEAEPEESSGQQLEFAFTASLDGEVLAQEILAASKSNLLWDDGLPIQFTLPQCEAVALRMKFRKAMTVDSSKRAAAMVSGAAMPDGRLPVLTDEDLYQALLVVPEGTEYFSHLTRRATALGFDVDDMRHDVLTAAAGGSEKYDFKQRLKMVKTNEAMKGGAYPIKDEEDLKNAIQAIGRAKDPAATKAHIMRRARALNLVKLLPEKWS